MNSQQLGPDDPFAGFEVSYGGIHFKLLTLPNILTFNAVLGLIMFEWAWAKTYRVRVPYPELDAHFPAYRRRDAPQWRKWQFYPGAITLLVPRLIAVIFLAVCLVIFINMTMVGQSKNEPIGGVRKKCLLFWYKLYTNLIALVGLFTRLTYKYVTNEEVNYYADYVGSITRSLTRRNTLGEAVGPQSASIINSTPSFPSQVMDDMLLDEKPEKPKRRVPKRGPGRPAVVICNHLGFIEILNLVCSPLCPGFTPKAELENVPLVGKIARGLQSLFLNRGGTQEQRDAAVAQIKQRQEQIEVYNQTWQPFCIFPEGTTSNGEQLFPFKRGAFEAMRSIQPCFCHVSGGSVRITYSILDMPVLFIMLMSELACRTATLHIMPPFTPNDAMLNIHKDKGTEDWEIYAWCLRDAIAKAGNFEVRPNNPYKERMDYYYYINGRLNELEVQGKMYYAHNRHSKQTETELTQQLLP